MPYVMQRHVKVQAPVPLLDSLLRGTERILPRGQGDLSISNSFLGELVPSKDVDLWIVFKNLTFKLK